MHRKARDREGTSREAMIKGGVHRRAIRSREATKDGVRRRVIHRVERFGW